MHTEEIEFVHEAFEKNWIAPLGFNCDGFESEMSAYLSRGTDTEYKTISLCSGTAALHLAVKLAGVKKGDIVLCSDMTFAATVNPVTYEGGIQVFVDSERDTWNMDPKALEKAFEKYPQAKVVPFQCLQQHLTSYNYILSPCVHTTVCFLLTVSTRKTPFLLPHYLLR